jgi:hypothetical protein
MPETFFRAVVFKRGDRWIGQLLERDIATQAGTFDDVVYELQRTLLCRLLAAEEVGTEPFEGLPAAPRVYWRMFDEGAPARMPATAARSEAASAIPIPAVDVHAAVASL